MINIDYNQMINTLTDLYTELDETETPRNCTTILRGLDPRTAIRKSLQQLQATAMDGASTSFNLALLKQRLDVIDLAGS